MAIHDLVVRIGAQVSPGFGSEVKKAFGMLSGMGGALGGLGLGGAVGAVAGLGSERLKEVAHLNDLNEGLGISVEYLSRLQRVASVTGTDFGLVSNQLGRMAAMAGEAPEKFLRLGVSVWAANGQLRDAEGLFKDVMEVLNKETNATERAAKAKLIFGRSFLEMLPLIREYGKEMGQATVLNKEAAEAAEAYDKNLNRIWSNLKERAGELSAPILTPLAAAGAEATAKGGLTNLGNALTLGAKVGLQNGIGQDTNTSLQLVNGLASPIVGAAMLQNYLWKKAGEQTTAMVTKAMDAAGGL